MKVKMKDNIKPVATLVLLAVFAAGCMPRPVPAPFVYTLEETCNPSESVVQVQDVNDMAPVLKLMPVQGAGPFTTEDILYRDRRHGLNSYAYSRWSDAPIRMVEGFLLTCLEHGGQFAAVLPPSSAAAGDLFLESALQDFSLHVGQDNIAEARVKMVFYLVEARTGRLIASREIGSAVPAAGTDARHAVAAVNTAACEAAEELDKWLAEEIARIE